MKVIEPRAIDWSSTQIDDGTLRVELTGANAKAWTQRFASVLALLDTPHNDWGEVKLSKKGITVRDVRQGSESELRHFLESVVVQANSDTRPPDAPDLDTRVGERRDELDTDEQMTATFRAFAN